MQPAIDLYSAIMLLGAAQGMFLALALVNAKGGLPAAHRLLALLTLLFSIDLGLAFLHQSGYIADYLRLLTLDTNIDFLFGPLAYLYVRSLTAREGFRFGRREWLHFLPFMLGFLILTPLMKLDSGQLHRLVFFEGERQDPQLLWAELSIIIVGVLSILQMAVYLLLSIRRLIRHQRAIRDQFSFLERINLTWLRNLLFALVILYLLYIADVLLSEWLPISEEVIGIHFLMIVFVIYSMGYLGLRQPAIFSQPLQAQTDEAGDPEADKPDPDQANHSADETKYQRSALDNETSTLLYRELLAHMEQKKVFLDNKLTLPQLASQLSISPNYLSQVINAQSGHNFFDFVNRYRVDEAKHQLASSKVQVNVLNIALEAGFNSKSAFYTAFKRHAGQTPSQYRKSTTTLDSPKQKHATY